MTSIGTSIAAAVAQTTFNAQQLARQRDRAHAQSTQDAKRVHELIQAHEEALEEGTETESADQLRITGQLPQHQSPQEQPHHNLRRKPEPGEAETSQDAAAEQPSPSPDSDGNLYRHLDVRA